MSARGWLKDHLYLPSFMRDFHDQKDLFKTIDHFWNPKDVSWVQAHIYVIDYFLRFMAVHGYILQRCRKKIAFQDIEEKKDQYKKIVEDAFSEMMNSQGTPFVRLPPRTNP